MDEIIYWIIEIFVWAVYSLAVLAMIYVVVLLIALPFSLMNNHVGKWLHDTFFSSTTPGDYE